MPSRYFTNVKEKFYYPTPLGFLNTIHSLLNWKFLVALLSLACTSGVVGALLEVLMQHSRHFEGQGKNIVKLLRAILAMQMH